MKLSTTILLLCAGSFCLFQGYVARVEAIPSRLLQKLHQKPQAFGGYDDYFKPQPYDEQVEEALLPRSIAVPTLDVEKDYVKPEPYAEESDEELMFPRNIVVPALDAENEYVKPEPYVEEEMIFPRNIVVPTLDVEDEYIKSEPSDTVVPEGRANECKVTIRGGLPKPQPVYLEKDKTSFYPYDSTGVMVVDAGKTLDMWCPGQFTNFAKTLVTATCVSGTTFKVDGISYSFKELTCKSWPGFVAEKTGASCNGGIMIRVGFKISSSRFAEQMKICFNEGEEVTRYVQHSLNPGSNYYETGVDRITFQTAGFFGGKSVDKLYTQATQKETIDSHLGGGSDKYFDSNKNIYLARGHMGAKADFEYATQQRATFLFVNAAPQWQVFNAGNWARVEDGVRAFVSARKINVNCYTGVWGVTTLPNSNGVQTPLYLSYDSNNNGQIPVPKIYFRVVIEPATQKGIVFVGVNNPHLTLDEIKRDYILCNDVSDKVTYINWKKTDITAGYSYACEVSEFRQKVTNLPALSASGGLLL